MQNIVLGVCLAGLVIGTITDLKTREVPDWLSYGLIFSGFGIAFIYAYGLMDYTILLRSIIGFVVMWILALIMYYTGQWGGGDSKIIMGIGALIGLNYMYMDWLTQFPFLLSFIFYSVVFGALYGMVWSGVLAFRNKKKFKSAFLKINSGKITRLIKKLIFAVIVIMIAFSFFFPVNIRILSLLFAGLLGVTFYLFLFIKAIESSCMIKKVSPEKLTEGDWIAEDVKHNGKVICGPKDLGVTKKQIAKLIGLKDEINKVVIKEGVPFVPSFLAAFLLSLFFGIKVFALGFS